MSEAAFFYNTTTQRTARPKHPSPSTSHESQTLPIRPLFATRSTRKKSGNRASATHDSSNTTPRVNFPDLDHPELDHMLSTPLPDYRHSANQTKQARAAAKARKNSTTSGNSAERKNALHTAESRTATTTVVKPEALGRASSTSSHTGSSGLTNVTSSDPPSVDTLLKQPFTQRNGRRYLRDLSLPYPLPCDLIELHRQTLRTMLLCQVFKGVVCSPVFRNKPPKRVLEVGCGTGFWSVSAHKHFSRQGFPSVSFTGIDIASLSPHPETEDDMDWRFVQHDLRKTLPFKDAEFDLVMVKDLSLVAPTGQIQQQQLMDEYIRLLKPGGVLEIWDGDHTIRMLLAHIAPPVQEDSDDEEDEQQLDANATGTYTLSQQTPLAAPRNQYLLEFNNWITKSLEPRALSPMPCTTIRPMLLQEEDLEEIDYRRLAIPLGELRWEREGIGGPLSPSIDGLASKGKEPERKILTAGQIALRMTALTTVVQMIESLEPLLREASGKGQDEWDRWYGDMMTDLLQNHGTSWGECLEVGAWWARKKMPSG